MNHNEILNRALDAAIAKQTIEAIRQDVNQVRLRVEDLADGIQEILNILKAKPEPEGKP